MHSLTALDGGEWSASRPGRFTSRERAPGTQGLYFKTDSGSFLFVLCNDTVSTTNAIYRRMRWDI
jgi:hypothetical protein